jgi:hypothetical protein
MIKLGLIQITQEYIHHTSPEIRRESVIMLGSLLSMKSGLENLGLRLFQGLKNLLFEEKPLLK